MSLMLQPSVLKLKQHVSSRKSKTDSKLIFFERRRNPIQLIQNPLPQRQDLLHLHNLYQKQIAPLQHPPNLAHPSQWQEAFQHLILILMRMSSSLKLKQHLLQSLRPQLFGFSSPQNPTPPPESLSPTKNAKKSPPNLQSKGEEEIQRLQDLIQETKDAVQKGQKEVAALENKIEKSKRLKVRQTEMVSVPPYPTPPDTAKSESLYTKPDPPAPAQSEPVPPTKTEPSAPTKTANNPNLSDATSPKPEPVPPAPTKTANNPNLSDAISPKSEPVPPAPTKTANKSTPNPKPPSEPSAPRVVEVPGSHKL
jgi:hypothetical protein